MQRVLFRIKGITPLMVTAPNDVPPTAPEFDKYQACLYIDDQGIYLPAEAFLLAAREAAGNAGCGAEFSKAVRLTTDRAEVLYEGPKTAEALFNDNRFVDRRFGRIRGEPLMLIRPIFPKWETEVEFIIKEDVMPAERLLSLMNDAGFDIGVGAYRQRFGRFEAAIAQQ